MFLKSGISHLHNSANVPPVHVYAIKGDKSCLEQCLEGNLKLRDQYGRSSLIYAAIGDDPECLELLLKSGIGVNTVDSFGRTALHWAALKNSYRCVKLLLLHSADWTLRDNDGAAAIHLASVHCPPKCMALLLKYMRPEEVDTLDNKKRTALHWCASLGKLNNIKLLIKRKSNIRIPDVDGKIPTHMAASSKSPDAASAIRVLLENSPSVLNWQDSFGQTALHHAIANGSLEVVEELISLETCNLNLADNMFRTPLHLAAVLGLSDVVKLLLIRSVNRLCTDFNGATPLHYATSSSQLEVVNILAENCFDIDVGEENGCTPLMWAAAKSDKAEVKALIQLGASLRVTDKHGATPLHIAASTGRVETIEIFLESGAVIDSTDILGRTPLFYACELGHLPSVIALLKHGSSIHHVDMEGRTALHWAAFGGHKRICEVLIRSGIGPNVCDYLGRTALIHGTFSGNYYCLPVLINNGANPHLTDNQGLTALHWACKQGFLDATEYLVNCQVDPNTLSVIEIGRDRCTALDLALLSENFEVARFIIKHGGISVIHIRNLAAIKIQACFRGYTIRKLLSVSFLLDSFHLLSSQRDFTDSKYSQQNTENSKENAFQTSFTKDHSKQGSLFDETDNDGHNFPSDYRESCSDGCMGDPSDSDSETNLFGHLEPSNRVKSVRINRKFFHNSGSRYFSAQWSGKSGSNSLVPQQLQLPLPEPGDDMGSSVSLSTFSRLSTANRHGLRKSCSRHRSLIQLSEQSSAGNGGLFERFRRRSKPDDAMSRHNSSPVTNWSKEGASSSLSGRMSLDDTGHRVESRYCERRHHSEGEAASCEALETSFSSSSTADSYDSSDLFEVPRWCTDRALCKVAENQWATTLMNYTFERIQIKDLPGTSYEHPKYL